jgi:UDP-2,4-diacetamido-2,4,6-trideoxy-beta-L-altropyranose hydrolase
VIAIRVAVSDTSGTGHLRRMQHVAKEITSLGEKVTFILDRADDRLAPFILGYAVCYLFEDQGDAPVSAKRDSERTLEALAAIHASTVLVDSYALDFAWEQPISAAGYKVGVIDDLCNREHYCDWLFDQKWCGPEETPERYKNLVSEHCERMLGPQYCILDSDYRQRSKASESAFFTVMLSLGGGGDLSFLTGLIASIIQTPSSTQDFRFLLVVGPLANNKGAAYELAKRDARIQLIENKTSLYEFYAQSDLFAGALGTSLYEFTALSLPALTFAIAENQINRNRDLEDLGHYLHLGFVKSSQAADIAELVHILAQQRSRVASLIARATIRADGYGARRIAAIVCGVDSDAPADSKIIAKNEDLSTTDMGNGIVVRPVNDSDINHYLDCRNLPENSQNMTLAEDISCLEHYRWWFNNNRLSFLVQRDGQPQLYFWHQVVTHLKRDYLIGGWFVCAPDVDFSMAMVGLKWQLDMTDREFPDATWIAIIKKTNNYVNLLNRYMGFTAIDADDEAFAATAKYFNNASPEEFNYVQLVNPDRTTSAL